MHLALHGLLVQVLVPIKAKPGQQWCQVPSYLKASPSAGCTGASTNCPAGSGALACAADGCQLCAAGTASPGGSHPCSTCPPNMYAALGAATCASCPSGYASLAGSRDVNECILCSRQYAVDANGLAGFSQCDAVLNEVSCNLPCASFGFNWTDTSPAQCTALPSSISALVFVGQKFNTANYAAAASLNTHVLSAALDLGPVQCACGGNPTLTTVTLGSADVQGGVYNLRGFNKLTFSSYEAGTGPEHAGFYSLAGITLSSQSPLTGVAAEFVWPARVRALVVMPISAQYCGTPPRGCDSSSGLVRR